MAQQQFKAKNPLDFARQQEEFNFWDYLEEKKGFIKSYSLGYKYSQDITDCCNITMVPQIVAFNNNYLIVEIEKIEEVKGIFKFKIHLTRLSNYVLEVKRSLVMKDINVLHLAEEQELEVIAINWKGEKSKPIKLNGSDKKSPLDFTDKLYKYGDFIDVFKSWQFKQIFDELYRNSDIPKYFNYKVSGLIKELGLWLMDNVVIELGTGNIRSIGGNNRA